MPAKCYNVVRGKRLRVTRLDECGNPMDPGTASALVVTKGFISVGLTAEMEDGDDITQKNADGDLCISDRSRNQFKRWTVNPMFCEVDPALLEIITNVVLEEDWDGNPVGVRQPEGASTDSYALELWTGVPGEDCKPGEPTTYGYLLLPFIVPGALGDITVENGSTTFQTSSHTKAPSGWGSGPDGFEPVPIDADNTPGKLTTPIGDDEHMLMRTTTIAPPDPVCGAQDMPAATS